MTGKERAAEKTRLIDLCMKKDRLTQEDIFLFDNVPVRVAGKYLNKSVNFIYYAMQENALPIGKALYFEDKWSYYISPAKLIAYKEGIYIDTAEAV